MLLPLAVVFMTIAGGEDLVVSGSSSLSSSSLTSGSNVSLLVPDSGSLNSSSCSRSSSSLSSNSGSVVVPDNSSSAWAEVSTTISLPDSSSSVRGLVGSGTMDEGGISPNLLHYQDRRWVECTSAIGLVPLGIRPRLAVR